MFRIIVFFLFFISGLTGLVYEIVWTRIFGLIFGNTTLAISTVLSAFMLGLAFGSLIIGRYADRISNHLKIYGILELGVGIFALMVPLFKGSLEALFIVIHPYLQNYTFLFYLIKFTAAFLIMIPATFLMGGTLPVLGRAVISSKKRLGVDTGTLYSINTFGAVIGTLLTAFLFIRVLGVNQSISLAVIANVFIGISALLLAKRRGKTEAAVSSHGVSYSDLSPKAGIVLSVMAVSGFTALSYEILWSRILVFLLTNSVYAFSVMLATFLIGIAIGSYFGGKIADRSLSLLRILGGIQVVIAVTAMLAAFLLINLPVIHERFVHFDPNSSWFYWNVMRFLEAFVIMFVPTLLMGASFPIAARIIVPDISNLGSGLGKVYFFNTMGGVLGSFLTGFIFIDILGTSTTTALMISINLLAGIYLLLSQRSFSPARASAFTAAAIVLLVFVILWSPQRFFTVMYGAVEKDYPLIDFREGVEGTVTVHKANLPMLRNKRIDVDGLNVAGTSFMLRTLQTLQGHLPLFVHPDPKKVLQIGFGTGQTSYSALRHPIKEFRVVEISGDVLDMARKHFAGINQDVLNSPRFHYTIMDGKNFVKYTPEKYDVIMNDANYAVATGSASLFTRDHFENCKMKLKPGGILSTWMTTDLDPLDFEIVLKTFQSVFPYSLLWMAPNCINKQVILMGSNEPINLDYARFNSVFGDKAVKDNLARINIRSAYDLLDCLVLDSKGVQSISKGASVNTDNHPVLEYSTHAIRSRDLCAYQNLSRIALRRPDKTALLTNLPKNRDERKAIEEKLERHEFATRSFLNGMMKFFQGNMQAAMEALMEGSRLIPESRLAAQYFTDLDLITAELNFKARQQPHDLEVQLRVARHRIAQKQYQDALDKLKRLSASFPVNPLVAYEKGRCYLALSQYDSAKSCFNKSLKQNPEMSAAWYFMGKIYSKKRQFDESVDSFKKALEQNPTMYEAYNELGNIYREFNSYPDAIRTYRQSLNILEYQPEIVAALGDCYLNLKKYDIADNFFRDAVAMGYASSQMYLRLGNVNYLQKNFEEAGSYYQNAAVLDSLNPEIYYNLGNAYVNQNKWYQAISAYEKAIQLNNNEPDYFNNLALCYRELGDYEQALSVFKKGLRRHSNSKLLSKNARGLQEYLENKIAK